MKWYVGPRQPQVLPLSNGASRYRTCAAGIPMGSPKGVLHCCNTCQPCTSSAFMQQPYMRIRALFYAVACSFKLWLSRALLHERAKQRLRLSKLCHVRGMHSWGNAPILSDTGFSAYWYGAESRSGNLLTRILGSPLLETLLPRHRPKRALPIWHEKRASLIYNDCEAPQQFADSGAPGARRDCRQVARAFACPKREALFAHSSAQNK